MNDLLSVRKEIVSPVELFDRWGTNVPTFNSDAGPG